MKRKKDTEQTYSPQSDPRIPSRLKHYVLTDTPEQSCQWSLSGPQFPQPTRFQQRYCYPKGNLAYSNVKGGALWTCYIEEGKEDLEYRLLHVYYSAKRAGNKNGNIPQGILPFRNVLPIGASSAAASVTPTTKNKKMKTKNMRQYSPSSSNSTENEVMLSPPFDSPLSALNTSSGEPIEGQSLAWLLNDTFGADENETEEQFTNSDRNHPNRRLWSNENEAKERCTTSDRNHPCGWIRSIPHTSFREFRQDLQNRPMPIQHYVQQPNFYAPDHVHNVHNMGHNYNPRNRSQYQDGYSYNHLPPREHHHNHVIYPLKSYNSLEMEDSNDSSFEIDCISSWKDSPLLNEGTNTYPIQQKNDSKSSTVCNLIYFHKLFPTSYNLMSFFYICFYCFDITKENIFYSFAEKLQSFHKDVKNHIENQPKESDKGRLVSLLSSWAKNVSMDPLELTKDQEESAENDV